MDTPVRARPSTRPAVAFGAVACPCLHGDGEETSTCAKHFESSTAGSSSEIDANAGNEPVHS